MGQRSNVVSIAARRQLRAFAKRSGLSQRIVESNCFDVSLAKNARTRRYLIRPGRGAGEWYCQVWHGAHTQHRGVVATELIVVHRLRAEYDREIAELELDGWCRVGATAKG